MAIAILDPDIECPECGHFGAWSQTRTKQPRPIERFQCQSCDACWRVAVDPVLAQENPICAEQSETLVNMIEGFVQLTTGLGVMGLLIVWQADSLMEMFTLKQEHQLGLKEHKRSALKSATILVLLGPLFTLMGSSMNLPVAECVDLIPF